MSVQVGESCTLITLSDNYSYTDIKRNWLYNENFVLISCVLCQAHLSPSNGTFDEL